VSENGDFQRKRQLAAQNPPNKAASTRNSPKKVRQKRLKNGFCKSLNPGFCTSIKTLCSIQLRFADFFQPEICV
jgi:hypothetical protein